MDACPNCGSEMADRFCGHCGQRRVSLRPTLHDLLHEGVHELVHVDGKIVKTLRLLVARPGALTREFLEGRRARYITPIRLYLICSLLFFATVAALPPRRISVTMKNSSFERLQRGTNRINSNPAVLVESWKHNIPRVTFLLMPLMGAVVYLFYRRAEATYVPHLYFAVHYHAFLFLDMTLVALLTSVHVVWVAILGPLALLGTLPYLVMSLRTVYGGTRTAAVVKGTVIWGVHWAMVLMAILAITLITVYEAAT